MDYCEQSLIRKLGLETVVHYLMLADQHSCASLRKLLKASKNFFKARKK